MKKIKLTRTFKGEVTESEFDVTDEDWAKFRSNILELRLLKEERMAKAMERSMALYLDGKLNFKY